MLSIFSESSWNAERKRGRIVLVPIKKHYVDINVLYVRIFDGLFHVQKKSGNIFPLKISFNES